MKLERKLSLNKETVVKLNADQMNNVKGGYIIAGSRGCNDGQKTGVTDCYACCDNA